METNLLEHLYFAFVNDLYKKGRAILVTGRESP
jgi:hypothetical protein